jgi:hypothetical protein
MRLDSFRPLVACKSASFGERLTAQQHGRRCSELPSRQCAEVQPFAPKLRFGGWRIAPSEIAGFE